MDGWMKWSLGKKESRKLFEYSGNNLPTQGTHAGSLSDETDCGTVYSLIEGQGGGLRLGWPSLVYHPSRSLGAFPYSLVLPFFNETQYKTTKKPKKKLRTKSR